MGFDKLTAPLAGRPVLAHVLRAFDSAESILELVLVIRADRRAEMSALVEAADLRKPVWLAEGGVRRADSVWAGVDATPAARPVVAVHDGARPLVQPSQIDGCVALAAERGAVALAAPVTDTLQRAGADGILTGAVDRDGLWAMQTPQACRRDLLVRALVAARAAGIECTDETMAVRALGEPVLVVPNDAWNPKITWPRDLELAAAWIEARGR